MNKLYARIATKILFFVCGINFASWASRIPEVKEHLHLGDAQLGTILLALPCGNLSALPLAGIVIGKFGSRKIALIATFIYFISMPLVGFSATTWALMASLFLFGFGGDLLNISMNVQAVGVESLYQKTMMSSFHGVFSLGFMSGFALGGVIASMGFSILQHLGSLGVLTLLTGLLCYRFLLAEDAKPNTPQPIFALPDKSLLLLSVICLCAMLGEGAMADWSVLYFKSLPNNHTAFVTAASTAFSVMMVTGRFLGDRSVGRWGIKKTLLFNCFFYALGMIIALSFPNPTTVIIGFGLTGLGLSTIVPLCYSEAGRSKTMSAGMALAAISTVGIAGFLFGPPLIGYLSEATNLRTALSILIVLGILSAVFTRSMREEKFGL